MVKPDPVLDKIFVILSEIRTEMVCLKAICPERGKQIETVFERLHDVEAIVNKQIGMNTIIGFLSGIIGAVLVGIVIHFLRKGSAG